MKISIYGGYDIPIGGSSPKPFVVLQNETAIYQVGYNSGSSSESVQFFSVDANENYTVLIGSTNQNDASKIGTTDVIIYQFLTPSFMLLSSATPNKILRAGNSSATYTKFIGSLLQLEIGDRIVINLFGSQSSTISLIDASSFVVQGSKTIPNYEIRGMEIGISKATKIIIFGMDLSSEPTPGVYQNNYSGIVVLTQKLTIISNRRLKSSGYDYNYLTGFFLSFGGLTNIFIQNTQNNTRFFKMDEFIGDLKQNVADVSDGSYVIVDATITLNIVTAESLGISASILDLQEINIVNTASRQITTYQKMYGGTVYYPSYQQYAIFQWSIDSNVVWYLESSNNLKQFTNYSDNIISNTYYDIKKDSGGSLVLTPLQNTIRQNFEFNYVVTDSVYGNYSFYGIVKPNHWNPFECKYWGLNICYIWKDLFNQFYDIPSEEWRKDIISVGMRWFALTITGFAFIAYILAIVYIKTTNIGGSFWNLIFFLQIIYALPLMNLGYSSNVKYFLKGFDFTHLTSELFTSFLSSLFSLSKTIYVDQGDQRMEPWYTYGFIYDKSSIYLILINWILCVSVVLSYSIVILFYLFNKTRYIVMAEKTARLSKYCGAHLLSKVCEIFFFPSLIVFMYFVKSSQISTIVYVLFIITLWGVGISIIIEIYNSKNNRTKKMKKKKMAKEKLKQKDNNFPFLQTLTLREALSPYKSFNATIFHTLVVPSKKILFAIIITFFDYFTFLQSILWTVLFGVTWILLWKFKPYKNARFNKEIIFEDGALSVICGWTLIFLNRNDLNNYAFGIGFNGVVLGAISFRIFSLLKKFSIQWRVRNAKIQRKKEEEEKEVEEERKRLEKIKQDKEEFKKQANESLQDI